MKIFLLFFAIILLNVRAEQVCRKKKLDVINVVDVSSKTSDKVFGRLRDSKIQRIMEFVNFLAPDRLEVAVFSCERDSAIEVLSLQSTNAAVFPYMIEGSLARPRNKDSNNIVAGLEAAYSALKKWRIMSRDDLFVAVICYVDEFPSENDEKFRNYAHLISHMTSLMFVDINSHTLKAPEWFDQYGIRLFDIRGLHELYDHIESSFSGNNC